MAIAEETVMLQTRRQRLVTLPKRALISFGKHKLSLSYAENSLEDLPLQIEIAFSRMSSRECHLLTEQIHSIAQRVKDSAMEGSIDPILDDNDSELLMDLLIPSKDGTLANY